ncbi:MAG TPA: di-heme oxidoredictase family protein [Kofleriaceae bacterium]
MTTTAVGGLLAGCASQSVEEPAPATTSTQQMVVGDQLAGISTTDFAAAKANFMQAEGVNDGLGPIFNERACGNCHTQGAIGGAGVQIERRFGKFVNGIFNTLSNEGGSLRQLMTLGTFTNVNGQTCTVPLEHEPADATVHNVGRLTTPLFGLGLVDSLPDSAFDSVVANEPAAVRGTANRVRVLLPDPHDPSQSINSTRVGRFGWKAGIANLVQFAADAYLNEMGITTQHCFKGTSVLSFATESKPNGVAQPAGCDDNGPGGPGIPAGTDDGVGSCAGGLTEIQEDVDNFNKFMTFLAPPPPDSTIDPTVAQNAFNLGVQIGCTGCHFPGPYTTPAAPANGVPGNMQFFPGSDFALHDMGSLGDLIGNDGDTVARTRMMRTAPLWGLRFRTKFLHDGRTSDLTTAILAHDGQALAARNAFNALSAADKSTLLTGLKAL